MADRMVLGVFPDRDDADEAVNDLESAGFNAKDISILMKDTRGDQQVVTTTGTGDNVASGAATGATTGGVIGGIAGLLVGIGAIALPGFGGLLIGGPLAAALGLTGAAATTISGAATGILAGGLIGALMGLGIPEEDARVYEDRIKQGGILVSVPTTTERENEVRAILEDNDADQIRSINFDRERTYAVRS